MASFFWSIGYIAEMTGKHSVPLPAPYPVPVRHKLVLSPVPPSFTNAALGGTNIIIGFTNHYKDLSEARRVIQLLTDHPDYSQRYLYFEIRELRQSIDRLAQEVRELRRPQFVPYSFDPMPYNGPLEPFTPGPGMIIITNWIHGGTTNTLIWPRENNLSLTNDQFHTERTNGTRTP